MLQFVGVAVVDPNLTVLVPCVTPKFVPVMVTTVPTVPEPGDTPAIPGPAPPTTEVEALNVAIAAAQFTDGETVQGADIAPAEA